jgi:hypothetical protein
MTKIAGSGSGSTSQRHGSADPDPDPPQNVMDPQHWLKYHKIYVIYFLLDKKHLILWQKRCSAIQIIDPGGQDITYSIAWLDLEH